MRQTDMYSSLQCLRCQHHDIGLVLCGSKGLYTCTYARAVPLALTPSQRTSQSTTGGGGRAALHGGCACSHPFLHVAARLRYLLGVGLRPNREGRGC